MPRLALRSRAEGVGSSPFRSLIIGKRGFRATSAVIGAALAIGGLLVVVGAGGPARAGTNCPTVAPDGTVTPAPAPGVDWGDCMLLSANLANANLTGANLSGAFIAGTDLSGATLAGANLNVAQLNNDNLNGANLSGATLADVPSTFIPPNGVTSYGLTGTPAALPAHWALLNGYLVGPGAELRGDNLAGLDLTGSDLEWTDLRRTNLTGANLAGADLADAVLYSTRLADANLSGANLSEAFLAAPHSGGVIVSPTTTLPAGWSVVGGYLMGAGTYLEGADLTGLDLAGLDLDHADLTGANLSGADLTGANLSSGNLSKANLAGLALTGVDLNSARLFGATIQGTEFANATLTGVGGGSLIGTPASLPADWRFVGGCLVGPGAALGGQQMTNLDLAGVDLQDAHLSLASLTGSNLSGADLTGADLSRATLTSTDLANAKLAGASLSDVTSGGITGIPASLPTSWLLVNGYLAGPGAVLMHASLAGADLAGVDLTGANFYDADLSHADLSQANLADSYLDSADLTGANLSGANLADVTLESSDLTDANLDGANLTNANLGVATLAGVSVVGTIWSATTCPDWSDSDKHVHGCTTPLDTTPPTVTVTGVANGHVYVYGAVPTPRCQTTDDGTVATAATLTLARGANGVGRFTATCAGAVDLAGNKQSAPVSVSYTVVYGVGTFLAPANGATISRSSGVITVEVRLASANGLAIAGSRQASLAAAHDVRVTLRGPGVSGLTAYCGWNATHGYLACAIHFPSWVRTGSTNTYTITVTENVGTGFLTVPAVHGGANPIGIHFR